MTRVRRRVDGLVRDALWAVGLVVATILLVRAVRRFAPPADGSAADWVLTVLPAVVVTLAAVLVQRSATASAARTGTGPERPGRTLRLRLDADPLHAGEVAALLGALDRVHREAFRFVAREHDEDGENFAPAPLRVTRLSAQPFVADLTTAGAGGAVALAALGAVSAVVQQPREPGTWFHHVRAGSHRRGVTVAERRAELLELRDRLAAETALLAALAPVVVLEPAQP